MMIPTKFNNDIISFQSKLNEKYLKAAIFSIFISKSYFKTYENW